MNYSAFLLCGGFPPSIWMLLSVTVFLILSSGIFIHPWRFHGSIIIHAYEVLLYHIMLLNYEAVCLSCALNCHHFVHHWWCQATLFSLKWPYWRCTHFFHHCIYLLSGCSKPSFVIFQSATVIALTSSEDEWWSFSPRFSLKTSRNHVLPGEDTKGA